MLSRPWSDNGIAYLFYMKARPAITILMDHLSWST